MHVHYIYFDKRIQSLRKLFCHCIKDEEIVTNVRLLQTHSKGGKGEGPGRRKQICFCVVALVNINDIATFQIQYFE